MTLYYKNHPIIKGGGVEFLILILIGVIINILNTVLLTFDKTTNLCYQIYLLSNTGFSFVFGSIFVKTYRIYKIFSNMKRMDLILKSEVMILIIILIALFHWVMALEWYIFDGVSEKKDYTVDKKEFLRCQYPISKNLSSLFNFVILVIEFILSYAVRNVEKKYKEALAVPAYAYILYMLLVNIMNNQNEVNVIIQDYFDIVGTILNTLVIIYYLFIRKFIRIRKKKEYKSPSNVKMFVRWSRQLFLAERFNYQQFNSSSSIDK